VVDGRSVATKPLRVIVDSEVRLAGAERERYDALLIELHAAHQAGEDVAGRLGTLGQSIADAGTRLDAQPSAPAAVRTQFDALRRDFEAVRVKFGVAAPQAEGQAGGGGRGGGAGPAGGGGGGGGGGRGGGGGNANQDALARLETVKNGIMGIWESPSAAMTRRADEARSALAQATTEANALITRARGVAQALQPLGITLTVPGA
jgi:hypothetical protein